MLTPQTDIDWFEYVRCRVFRLVVQSRIYHIERCVLQPLRAKWITRNAVLWYTLLKWIRHIPTIKKVTQWICRTILGAHCLPPILHLHYLLKLIWIDAKRIAELAVPVLDRALCRFGGGRADDRIVWVQPRLVKKLMRLMSLLVGLTVHRSSLEIGGKLIEWLVFLRVTIIRQLEVGTRLHFSHFRVILLIYLVWFKILIILGVRRCHEFLLALWDRAAIVMTFDIGGRVLNLSSRWLLSTRVGIGST